MKKYILEIIVFICGAIGMILELIAARVLSPYVGSSNLVWTTIIGIMLTSMSIGYFVGGKIVDKKPDRNILAVLIVIGSFSASLIPIFETIVVSNIARLSDNLIFVALITSAIVFGIPSFILATVSPFAVKLNDRAYETIGKTSGKISSISTIGSIFGTFLGGFFLIPTFGVRTIVLVITIILLALAVIVYNKKNIKHYILAIILLIIAILLNIFGEILFKSNNPDIIQDIDSQYSRIWVKEIQANNETYKTMQVDTGLESYINTKTNEMGAQYLYYYNLFDYFNKDAKTTLMIGGAAYTYPNHYLNKFLDKTIHVSEIDNKMTEIASKEFGLDINNPRLKIYHQDGRSFLNYTKNRYDTILIDAFKGLNAPFELTTYEALINTKNILNDNGMVITNIISSLEGKDEDFIKYEYSTYKAVFDDVKLYKVRDTKENKRQNLILVGFKGNKNINKEKYNEYKKYLDREIKDFSSDKIIVTDNYSPIGN